MPKFVKISLDTLRNDATAVAAINENFSRLETLLDQMVSRDGTSPNTLNDVLDMNQNRLVNLPFPLSPTEPVRLQDITDATEDLAALMEDSLELLQEAESTASSILPQMEIYRDETVAAAGDAETAASTAVAAASEAEGYAETAAEAPASFTATSSTSLSIGTGSKAFTIDEGKFFSAGQFIIAAREGGSQYMYGTVDSYSGTTLTLTVTATSGSGTYSDWVIGLSGIPGPQGEQGSTGPGGPGSGDVEGPDGATDGHIVLFDGTTGKLLKSSGKSLGQIASADLADPGADRIVFWDDSTGVFDFLVPGNGLSLSGTTLTVNPGTGLGISGSTVAITDAELLAIAGLTSAANKVPYFTGSGTAALADFTTLGRSIVAASTAATVKTALSLENVNNTSDASKPVSTATQTALDAKADYTKGVLAVESRASNFVVSSNDFGKVCLLDATCTAVFLPSDSTAPAPLGTVLYFYFQSNNTTIDGATGATLIAPNGKKGLAGNMALCIKLGSSVWFIQGGMTT